MVVSLQPTPLPVPGGAPRITGIIYPPTDIRTIIDKTAQFVAKAGPALESKILEKEKNNPNFAFLKPLDPYNAYYKHKITEFKQEAGVPAEAQRPQPSISAPPEPSKEAKPTGPKIISAVAKVTKPRVPVQPPAAEFILGMPDISAQELDIMRLTAQFVARNGAQFHSGLLNREFKNPQFEFLKATNPLNIYFTALVDSYTRVLLPPRNIVDKFKTPEFRDKTTILDKAMSYMEWETAQERARKKAEEEQENERMAMALIDWHDFVVVETIDFFDDETDLPAPASVAQLESAEDMEMEMEEEEAPAPPPPPAQAPAAQPPAREPAQAPAQPPAREPSQPAPPPPPAEPPIPQPPKDIKILKEVIRHNPPAQTAVFYITCPRCNQRIPENEYNEHMRIELLDPRYSAQKRALEERQKVTALANPDDIRRNLELLASKRTDIFGGADEEVEIGKSVNEDDRKEEKVTWDGHTASIGQTTTAALANLQETVKTQAPPKPPEDKPAIGPAVPDKLVPQAPIIAPHVPIQPPRPPTGVVPPGAPGVPPGAGIGLPRPPGLPMGMPYGMPPMPMGLMGVPGMMAPMAPYMPMPPSIVPPGMVQPPGMPPPPPAQAPPPQMQHEEEPSAKRQKTEEINLIPEEQFLAQHSGPVNVIVQVPHDTERAEWNFNGQNITLTLNPRDSIQTLKDKIKEALNMPQNKQKLKAPGISVLKDQLSLAYYNVRPGTVISLGMKERGGRKK